MFDCHSQAKSVIVTQFQVNVSCAGLTRNTISHVSKINFFWNLLHAILFILSEPDPPLGTSSWLNVIKSWLLAPTADNFARDPLVQFYAVFGKFWPNYRLVPLPSGWRSCCCRCPNSRSTDICQIPCEVLLRFLPAAAKLGQGNVFTGVCDSVSRRVSASVHAGIPTPPPGADTPRSRHPPGNRHTPPTPPRSRHPPESRLRHTVNERPVRILLECILVWKLCRELSVYLL